MQPKLNPDTKPVSGEIGMFLAEIPHMGDKEPIKTDISVATLKQWLTWSADWEKLAAEFEAELRRKESVIEKLVPIHPDLGFDE